MGILAWFTSHPILSGIFMILAIYLIVKLGSIFSGGRFSLTGLITSADNRLSVSEFQMLLWTFVIVWAYFASFAFFKFPESITIPNRLLILMGFSLGSFVGSKAIGKSTGTENTPDNKADKPRFDDLFKGKEGFDLGKFQMFAWTIVAVTAYVIRVLALLNTELEAGATAALLDIDETMLGLMGLSQAGYLGKKMVTK